MRVRGGGRGEGYLASVLIEGADDRRHQGAILLGDDAPLVRLGQLGVGGDTGRLVRLRVRVGVGDGLGLGLGVRVGVGG